MGSEPCQVYEGPLAGTMVFAAEERAGLDLMRSLDDRQAARLFSARPSTPMTCPRSCSTPSTAGCRRVRSRTMLWSVMRVLRGGPDVCSACLRALRQLCGLDGRATPR